MLVGHSRHSILAWWQGRVISAGEFLSHVRLIAAQLPDAKAAINLCEDRYLFMVAFAALLSRGQANLLPPNRAPQVVTMVAEGYEGCYYLAEQPLSAVELPHFPLTLPEQQLQADEYVPPLIPDEQLSAVLFTSGTTGKPIAYSKKWGCLVEGNKLSRQRLGLEQRTGATIVATVPPQHMFGLETTVLYPLLGGMSVHGGRPFFPEDLRRALTAVDAPRILVTTPLHLRACIEAGLHWPPLERVISATAPLSRQLACQAKDVLGCVVEEIYGSTETGAIATRRTVADENWLPLDGVTFVQDPSGTLVHAPFLPESVYINDVIELLDDGGLRLVGRHADMVKIAGKRASLGDLTHKILEIEGVHDAVLLQMDEHGQTIGRLCAVVVAPGLDSAVLQRELLQRFDPVFVPRPLYRVERLPRNESGKLPREELLRLVNKLRSEHGLS